ncbi:MAG TPA: carboxypeptidase regulatory-like domain-containing protein, partial [Gemmatimonadaceae bacterium]|nr:carboxypeptidase regulatory-like domain-containing protein [Gemmatimonadaceae bacterium]
FARADVDADGTFALTGLRPGSYMLMYQGTDGRSVQHDAEAPAADVVLELPATAEIRGRVIDAATREAIPAFSVQFGIHSDAFDGDGTFALQVAPDNGELSVTADGYVKATTQVAVDSEQPTDVSIELTRGRNVSGIVTDDHGSPLPEAWIMTDDISAMAQSTNDGSFHLDGVSRQAMKIRVREDGYLTREVEIPAGDHDARVDVVLSAGRKVSGHVVTHDGAPVEGATVTAMGEGMPDAKTDATGAFTLAGLGIGTYMLQAERDELQSESTALGNEVPNDLVLMMKPSAGAGGIHGVVKGFAGSNWMFGVIRTSPGDITARIGRDGTYTIERAPVGELELQAWAQSSDLETTSAPVKVTVIADGDVEANLAFRDDIAIRGVVTESGAPAARRKVRFSSEMAGWSTLTDKSGAYELKGVEPGRLYDVEVSGGSTGREYRTRHHVAGSGTFDINIEWSRIEGRVIDAAGAALPGAKIELTTEEKHEAGSSTTDNTGAFGFAVSQGNHIITVAKVGYATFTQRVEAAAAPLLVRMTQSGGLHVRLTDARDGRTLDGYVVAIDMADLPVARADEAQTDGAMLVPVAPGPYRIAVSANGYASQSTRVSVPHEGEVRFALTAGGTLIVQTDRAAAELVKLVMPGGEEYVRCQCNGIAEIRLTGTTTTIDHVAPGTYTMLVLDAHGLIKTSHSVTIVEGQTTRAEIRVPE